MDTLPASLGLLQELSRAEKSLDDILEGDGGSSRKPACAVEYKP